MSEVRMTFSAVALRAPGPFSAARFASRSACVAVLLLAHAAGAQQITLKQAVDLAQKQGYQARAAVATRDAARAHDRAFNARLLPQLSLNATAPEYQRSITPVIQPDGSTLFTPVQQTTANAGMTISQKLPFTGGNLSVASSLQRYQLTGAGTQGGLTWTSTPVRFSLEQPLMRPNTIRWDDRVQDAQLEVSERQYLEAREGVALQATNSFFDFYIAKKQLDNAIANAAINDTLYTLNKGRLEVGKIGENDLLQSELALLRARQSAENARLEFDRAQDALRLVLNLDRSAPLDVAVPSDIPEFEPDTALAVAQALQHRAAASQLDLDAINARRHVAEARLNNGIGAMVNASVGFNQ
ncbi:MAG TPA: TolC family protein, partial [Gemmatimonadaceae bacterium]|nr:TolC family protein [Gemmatimonadaceae bacterium]